MKFLFFFLLLSSFSHGSEVDYSIFSSQEELFAYEKSRLQDESLEGEALAQAYLDIGESYLFNGDYELALEHLFFGYKIAQNCEKESKELLSRGLFGIAVTYANLNRVEESYFAIQTMGAQLRSYHCSDCYNQEDQNDVFLIGSEDFSIFGPDKLPIRDCIERAQGVAKAANELISLVTRVDSQFFLRRGIDALENGAIECCLKGGIWKACLRPIAIKYHNWNQKWKVFNIPPDPAWD